MLNDLLKKRFTTREWKEMKKVPYELIQGILQDVYDAPRKNGKTDIVVKLLTPSVEGTRLKKELLKITWCRDGDKGAIEKTGPIRLQGQLTAPYVFIFGTRDKVNNTDCVINSTLQATVAMISAEEKGLNTGYCCCLDSEEVFNSPVGMWAYVCLGVGYAEDTDDRSEQFEFNKDWGIEILPNVKHVEMTNCTPGFRYGNERDKPPMSDMSDII